MEFVKYDVSMYTDSLIRVVSSIVISVIKNKLII